MKISDNEIKKICSPTIYKRGIEYFKEGRVHLRTRKDDSIVASVDDDLLYNVHITLDGDKIKSTLCTCPYYQTMGCACKHIVATLKTRQSEIDRVEGFSNENDLLASSLCKEFDRPEPLSFRVGVTFRITPTPTKISYSIALSLVNNDSVFAIQSVEKLLDAIISNREYRLSKSIVYTNSTCSFDGVSEDIISILCEAQENKAGAGFFSPSATEAKIGKGTAKRLFPLLDMVDCTYIIDSMFYRNLPIQRDNPDILVDIQATDMNINISVTESGISLTPEGDWFFFEGKIFNTDLHWRSWFMPIYRAMILNKRTQLEFSGDNSIHFAAKVLPSLKNQQQVVCYGVDELVVNEKPEFKIYFDRYQDGISAVIKVFYGSISLILPTTSIPEDKILVRDFEAENKLLLLFSDFIYKNGLYILDDADDVFLFITKGLPVLENEAELILSDSFLALTSGKLPEINTHIGYNEEIDLLEFSLDSPLSEEELSSILLAYKNNQSYWRLNDGNFIDLKEKNQELELFETLPLSLSRIKKKQTISKFYSLYLAQLSSLGYTNMDRSLSDMIDRVMESSITIPSYLSDRLRDYQKMGVNWFYQLSRLGLGGILADDMGLGKTLQVIAYIMSVRPDTPSLVVCPTSLVYNWYDEIMKFAPVASVKIIDGTKEEREKLLGDIEGADFVITSYALLRRDIELYKDISFSYFFIDEAQHIKNPRTMNAKTVKMINAQHFFALTGTPVENSLSELWSIFDFVMTGYLSSHTEFINMYEKKAKLGKFSGLSGLKNKTRPFILRRLKKDVLGELPEKIETTILADFEPEQKKVYKAFMQSAKEEASEIVKNGDSTVRILSLLTRLRQICCHPALINSDYKKDSGKLMLLMELVTSAIVSDHRILIFSQFTSMLDIIANRLRLNDISYFYLDGSTPAAMRIDMSNRFNSGERNVFLISLKAGGTGLNLTGADMVIHYDPWWNPAVVDQASDRAHRIGQTKAVQIIKLASRGSIEEQILKLAQKKKGLADRIIKENKNLLSALSKEELLSLFE